MAPKWLSRSKPVSTRIRNYGVTKRKPASAKAYTACRSLQSPKAVIDFLGLSYSQAGAEYARLMGGRSATRQSVYKALSAKRISDDWLEVLGQLISNRLTRLCGETIGITIVQNSPMHVVPWRYCDDCGSMYAIDRPDVKRCRR
ncbi:hypothetical protein GPROT1_00329 [Gammaproteobacteria bacterium]|nr:hypothetical protein GPROT1_00329 [Gammaproteobacteria bacterium]